MLFSSSPHHRVKHIHLCLTYSLFKTSLLWSFKPRYFNTLIFLLSPYHCSTHPLTSLAFGLWQLCCSERPLLGLFFVPPPGWQLVEGRNHTMTSPVWFSQTHHAWHKGLTEQILPCQQSCSILILWKSRPYFTGTKFTGKDVQVIRLTVRWENWMVFSGGSNLHHI